MFQPLNQIRLKETGAYELYRLDSTIYKEVDFTFLFICNTSGSDQAVRLFLNGGGNADASNAMMWDKSFDVLAEDTEDLYMYGMGFKNNEDALYVRCPKANVITVTLWGRLVTHSERLV